LLVVALAALAIQLVAWALVATGLARVRAGQPPAGAAALDLPITVIVAARNEETHLPALLDTLEAQTHPTFEVVVVDDRSTDGTAGIVESRGGSVRLLRVRAGEPEAAGVAGKKHAIDRGVEAAAHERIALTDADCRPGPDWLAAIARHAAPAGDDEGAVLVGYGPYARRPGALAAFVRYETLSTAILTAAAIGLGCPFMAVGRNISYQESLLARLGGMAGAARGLSGDDDLIVQSAARAGVAVRYVLDAGAFVESDAPATVRAWLRQKRRHASAGRRYRAGVLLALGAFHATGLAVWLAPVVLGWTGAAILAARLLAQRAVLRGAFTDFDARDLSLPQPALDAAYALYNVGFAIAGLLPDPRRW
jgi:glycosyltransferase involved in cell wall biosynthesis